MSVVHVLYFKEKMERDRYLVLSDASYEPWDWYDTLADIEGEIDEFYKRNFSIDSHFYFGVFSENWNLNPDSVSEYSLIKKIQYLKGKGGYTQIQGRFSAEGYDKKYLKVLDVLEEDGVALIFVPMLNYSEISTDIEQQGFFVNAIFSQEDSREATSEIDKDYIIPVYCKCL